MKHGAPLKRTPFKPKSYDLKVQSQLSTNGYIYPIKRSLQKKQKPKNHFVHIGEVRMMIWTSAKADSEMSLWVRSRDKYCLKCGIAYQLTNSHFHGRSHSGTRYIPDNCDTFCVWCHEEMETEKNGEYKIFKVKQLGEARFNELQLLAKKVVPRESAIIDCMKFLIQQQIIHLDEIEI